MLLAFDHFQPSELHARDKQKLKKCLTAGVAVESEVVLGAALEASDLVLGG
jgi:hypothetical protein